MVKVNIELTLDELIEAAKKLSPEEQIKLIKSLVPDEPPEETPRPAEQALPVTNIADLTEAQLRAEVLRQVHQVRAEHEPRPGQRTRRVEDLLGDFVTTEDLTVFTDLDEDDFQA